MKYAGIGLVAASVSMTGVLISRLIRRRLFTVEAVLLFLSMLQNELSLSLSSIPQATECLKDFPALYSLDFLGECARMTAFGEDFPKAWRTAIYESRALLKKQEKNYLIQMAEGLSKSDLQGQERIFEYYRFCFSQIREKAASDKKRYSGASLTVGILISALLVVILI